jgi:hypothetical protein
MKISRIINSVIVASLIISLCSCGNSGSSVQPDDSADVTEQTAENETTADEITFLPAGFDLGGETYGILHGQTINEGDTENEVTYDLADLSAILFRIPFTIAPG